MESGDVKLDTGKRFGDLEADEADVTVAAESCELNVTPLFVAERHHVASHVLHRGNGEPLGTNKALETFLKKCHLKFTLPII